MELPEAEEKLLEAFQTNVNFPSEMSCCWNILSCRMQRRRSGLEMSLAALLSESQEEIFLNWFYVLHQDSSSL